mmetsp:Transcript_4517/g.6423  ORF Transcript_4517/g.6423 Transcript_4517/m.6423 type:complete len:894 (-) Transcript_4517:79-2760(-)
MRPSALSCMFLMLRVATAFTPRSTASFGLLTKNTNNVQRTARSTIPKLWMSTTEEETTTTSSAAPNAYPFAEVETKWQQYWKENNTFKTPVRNPDKPKKYVLDMFPYPSGAGLHVGHPEGYTASDVMARFWRMQGYDVLHPIGWDSFGLPAEQFAIQTGTKPEVTTGKNIANFKRQLQMLGFSYDWEKEVATTDVDYVKWTQWIFLQLYKKGLAEQSSVSVNWCPALGTVLANEEVINGLSERGDHPVERLPLRQWILKITDYADRLEAGLEGLDWPSGTLTAQQQWIGKSTGCNIDFAVEGKEDETISVFTTRADTIMGVTYVTLAPEHPLVSSLCSDEQKEAVDEYVKATSSRSDLDRTSSKEKTGVFTGGYVIHPISGERVPVWVGDYVLGSYGTGAVMAVPAHDARDFEFAAKFGLEVKWVIKPQKGELESTDEAFTAPGIATNSGEFDGLSTGKAKKAVGKKLKDMGMGGPKVTYKLRDWVFSRQRYWGEPIPIYFPVDFPEGVDPASVDPKDDGCEHTIRYDQGIPVDEADLPLKLPEMEDFTPGDDPAGCLARAKDWRYFQQDGKWFARETNTMPQWAGSCWYYFRYLNPKNDEEAFSKKDDQDWMPVDLYVGGAEHAVLHLLYARFWHQVLFDLGYTQHPEPFQKLVHQGMILGSDGEKMSKSRGNVVNPDDIVESQGGDALRMYEMFMGPLEAVKPWQTEQVSGVVRFQNKLYNVVKAAAANDDDVEMDEETTKILHKTMKKVTEDVEAMSFNTAISAMMVLTNHLQSLKKDIPREAAEKLALMVSPFAPHLGEECWQLLGHEESLTYHPWVEYDEALTVDSTIKMGVQVNGKVRGEIEIAKDADQDTAMELAMAQERVAAQTEGKDIKKVIFVPGRILNIVAK